MSHSRIIQLAPVPIPPEHILIPDDLYDDWKVQSVSEYVSELSQEETLSEIASLRHSPALRDTATVDVEARKVTFRDRDTLAGLYDKWFGEALAEASSEVGSRRIFHSGDLRTLFSDFRGDANLFVLDWVRPGGRLCHTAALRSAELIAFLAERDLPREWHIGAVIDSKDA